LFGSFWSGWLRGEIPFGQRRPARGRLRASICVGRLGGCFFGAADRDAVNGRARPVRRGSISSPAPRVHEVVFVSFVALRVRQVLQTWESGNSRRLRRFCVVSSRFRFWRKLSRVDLLARACSPQEPILHTANWGCQRFFETAPPSFVFLIIGLFFVPFAQHREPNKAQPR